MTWLIVRMIVQKTTLHYPDFVRLKMIVVPVAGLRKTVTVPVGFVVELVMMIVALAVGPMTIVTVHFDFVADLAVAQKMIVTERIVAVVVLS
jgi:hypothetical protein